MRSICIITRPNPGASATLIRSFLYPLLLIISQTPYKTKLGATVPQWARRCSLCRGAQLPHFCFFPTLLEQLSAAKGLKTWARFPCTSLFLTGSSYLSSPVLSGYLFCRLPTCPGSGPHTFPSQSLLFSQCYRHSISNTQSSRSKSKVTQLYFKFSQSLKLRSL